MFSLAATLAFGSFAMANNVELLPVEGVENIESTKNIEFDEVLNVDCIELTLYAGQFAEAMGLNDDQQFLFMQQTHRQCACQHYNQCY